MSALPAHAAALFGLLDELVPALPHTAVELMLDVADPFGRNLLPVLGERGLTVTAADNGFVIRRASLLVAFWDGDAEPPPAEDGDLVLRYLGGRVHDKEPVDRVAAASVGEGLDEGLRVVYWVPVARRGSAAPLRVATPHYVVGAREHVLDVQASMPLSLQRRLADLDEFNAEAREGAAIEGPAYALTDGIPAEFLAGNAAALDAIHRQYLKADALAVRMQLQSDRLFNLFGISAAMMGLAYLIYEKITNSRILLIIYMAVLAASLVTYYALQSRRWFGRHLAYRALAETLRVRFYLTLAGVTQRMHTRQLIELTGIYQFRGFGWIGYVLDAIEPAVIHVDASGDDYARRARFVDEAWIGSQYAYFRRKVAVMQKVRRRVRLMKGAALGAVLVVIGTMFVFGEQLDRVDVRTGLPVKNLLTFCSGILAVLLGVWELRQNKMATQELLWQYNGQLTRFGKAREQLQRTTGRARREALLTRLGEASLMEIYLWAIHRYHREHAPSTSL